MFVQEVALGRMPTHALVEDAAIARILKRMAGDGPTLQRELDRGFRAMELRQPALSAFLADELAHVSEPAVQTLSYFLFVVIHEAFVEAFASRLGVVSEPELRGLVRRLITDGELRSSGQLGDSYSEDLVALGQPALVRLVRQEVHRVVEEAEERPGWQQAEPLYEAILLEILALSHAVAPA